MPPKNPSSRYRGVTLFAAQGKYQAFVYVEGRKRIHLGMWRRETDAAIARDRAVLHFGLDTPLNFPTKSRKRGPASPQALRAEGRQSRKAGTSSQYLGVTWDVMKSRWKCAIGLRGGKKEAAFVARFDDPRDAAIAYDRVARHMFGAEAELNFPDEPLEPATIAEMRLWARQLWKEQKATSQYNGVYWSRDLKKWVAQIGHERHHEAIGYFDLEEEAAEAYDRAAKKLKGKKAVLNFR